MQKIVCIFSVFVISIAQADTEFLATVDNFLTNAVNWSNGLPADQVAPSNAVTINIDGEAPGTAQNGSFFANTVTTVGGGATVLFPVDTGLRDAEFIVNNGVIIANDDIFAERGILRLNAGSSATAVDDFEANNLAGQIYITGGVHASGPAVGNNFGAQGSATKIGCGIHMTGGQITAGTFRFQVNSTNDIGGTAVLLSAVAGTDLTMDGTMDITSDWTGSWTVEMFSGTDWKTEVTGGGWTLDGVSIDSALFDASFIVSSDGKTLQGNFMAPQPEISGFTQINSGQASLSFIGGTERAYVIVSESDLLSGSFATTVTPVSVSVGTQVGSEITTDTNGNATAVLSTTNQVDFFKVSSP